jgi:hypothetical protein
MANVIIMGAAEGSIMASIMMDHMISTVRKPGTFHSVPADIQRAQFMVCASQ